MNRTRNTPNRILAIPAAAPAILEKPSSAANNAMIRKKIDQDNMWTSLYTDNYMPVNALVQFMIYLKQPRKVKQGHRAFP
jgi:hypothetical protein